MNVEMGTPVVAQFLFRGYLFRIFGIGSLQCVMEDWKVVASPAAPKEAWYLWVIYCKLLVLYVALQYSKKKCRHAKHVSARDVLIACVKQWVIFSYYY